MVCYNWAYLKLEWQIEVIICIYLIDREAALLSCNNYTKPGRF